MADISVRLGDPTANDARALLQASHDLMTSLFPAETNRFFSVEKLQAANVAFFLAGGDGPAVDCAPLANKGHYGEIKSMFVSSAARGKGIADQLLCRLKATATAQNLTVIRLETGTGLNAAHRLYQRYGFKDCHAFGDYEADAPFSRYMELTL